MCGKAVVFLIFLIPQLVVGDCPATECCELVLNEDPSLSGESWMEQYANAKVSVDLMVRNLPVESEQCHQAVSFLDNEEDDVASTTLLYDYCSEFCREKDITIMSGAGWFGLGLKGALDVCLESATPMTKDDEEFCGSDQTMCNIEGSAGGMISTMSQVTYATLLKQTSVLSLVEQARELALDPENQERIQDAVPSQVPAVILDIYSSILGSFLSQDDTHAKSLQGLTSSFGTLETAFNTYFDRFLESLSKCNKMIPRTENDYLLYDVCSQQSTQCIEGDEAQHVSCCCVYNPLTRLDGLSLIDDPDISSCIFYDICSESRRSSREWASDVESEIDASVYFKFTSAMDDKYGTAFNSFSLGTSSSGSTSPTDEAEAVPLKSVTSGSGSTCGDSKAIRDFDVPLPHDLGNPDNAYGDMEMVYDFEGEVQSNWCNDIYGREDGPLFDRCSAFCGAGSVPMLIGSPKSGVNAGQALGVCFDPALVGANTDAAFCDGSGLSSYSNLQSKVAELASKITNFKQAQILWVTKIIELSELIKERADAEELKQDIQSQNSDAARVTVYQEFYRQQFAVLESTEDQLVDFGNGVRDAFTAVASVFAESKASLERYTSECSRGFPRTVGNQAMLAICPVAGDVCPDDPTAKYVYCCCSHNNFLASTESVDVCAEAKGQSETEYQAMVDELLDAFPEDGEALRRSGQQGYYGKYLDGMERKYGSDFDPPSNPRRANNGGSGSGSGGGGEGGGGEPINPPGPESGASSARWSAAAPLAVAIMLAATA